MVRSHARRSGISSVDDLESESVSTEETTIGNDAHLAYGGDLSAAVEDLLAAGRSIINVSEPEEGTWTWKSSLTVDPTEFIGGFEINATGAVIDDQTGGLSIIVDSAGDIDNQLNGRTFRLQGGYWLSSVDTAGFVRLKDCVRYIFAPSAAAEYQNTTNDSVTLSVENHKNWCEAGHIGGEIEAPDIGVDFKPASVTGGTGTDSFQATLFTAGVNSIRTLGVRFRGVFAYSTVQNPRIYTSADGAVGTEFDATFGSSVFVSPKWESFADNCTAIETGDNYGTPPVLIQPAYVNFDTNITKANSSDVIREWRHDNIQAGLFSGTALSIDGRWTRPGVSRRQGQQTVVDTSSSIIYSSTRSDSTQKGLLVVFTTGGGGDEFVDLLLWHNEAVVPIKKHGMPDAPGRDYGVEDSTGVTLSLGSGSTTVQAEAIETDGP